MTGQTPNYYPSPPDDLGLPPDVAPSDIVNALDAARPGTLGRCLQNALGLGHELHSRGVDCDIMWGGYYTKDLTLNDKPLPETLAEAEAHPIPCIHFWIEIPRANAPPLVAEIASEARASKGDTVLLADRPTRYMVFPESRQSYTPMLAPNDFEWDG